MLHVFERPHRRRWLQLGGLGLLGLSLPRLLAAGSPPRRPAARSCVLLLLHGGPSQLDTWDPKPAAPENIRGEFRPVPTSVPGVQICEHLPRLARLAHRYTVVRSASILHAVGVNPGLPVRDAFGREVPLSTGRVRPALFGG